MKKQIYVFVLLIYVFSLMIVPVLACAEMKDCEADSFGYAVCMENSVQTALLPYNLSVVEEEAFAGTALRSVVLPESTTEIGENAFSDNWHILYLYIPANVEYLPENVLENNSNTSIVANAGSYAEQWARANGYRIIYQEVLLSGDASEMFGKFKNEKLETVMFLLQAFILMLVFLNRKKPNVRRVNEGNTMRPQERMELHSIQYRFP